MRRHLLELLLAQPTSPFREGLVITAVQKALDEGDVPYFSDPIGNIVVGASSPKEYRACLSRDPSEPTRLFIAHMDHPGFHGAEWLNEKRLRVQWHGGSPTAELEGARMWLATRHGWLGHGELRRAKLLESRKAIQTAEVLLDAQHGVQASALRPDDVFGGFAFRAPVWTEGERIYTKAADDLVGCFAIVSTALDVLGKKHRKRNEKKKSPPFLGLLTRAEEVGAVGAIGHFELGWHRGRVTSVLVISLEASRALPQAEIGKGPVVRLGDKYSVFNPGMLRVFSDLAEKRLPGRHQRRIMDGGTCEASAATVYGLPAIGISVPLGNYHNQCFEGGADARGRLGPAPEFVHQSDVQGLLELCVALLDNGSAWAAPFNERQSVFRKSFRRYRPLLKRTL